MSHRDDPWWNLAIEEQFLDRAADAPPALFLWRSRPSVIIGKNQNPWRECNLAWMQEHKVALARRHTGGGAVYHDPGNLNYAYFLPRAVYDADEIFQGVQDRLAHLGLTAERMNRTSLAVQGRKISGNAFCFRRNGAQHHGTLLINADVEAVQSALQPPPWSIDTRATASVRAHVANLTKWLPDITVDHVMATLANGAIVKDVESIIDLEKAAAHASDLASDEWCFRKTPPFAVAWDGITVHVREGLVESVEPLSAGREWIGQPFSEQLFASAQ